MRGKFIQRVKEIDGKTYGLWRNYHYKHEAKRAAERKRKAKNIKSARVVKGAFSGWDVYVR